MKQREIGPYRLEERLGAGGMGEVYRAWDERLDRSVAVKLIRPESADNAVARERLRREARAAAGLSHPSVVQIHDIVSTDEADAIVMELVTGESLSSRLLSGPLEIDEAVRLGREIAEGLAAAHARGLLHRDLKAENVMITPEGHAKILDFGLAKKLEGEESLTRTAGVIGTFRAMSPEQARGLPLDARSDLFSFGVLLYEMLTGESPFQGSSAPDTLTRVCFTLQKPVRERRPEVTAALSGLVDRLLAKDLALRPAGAAEVASELGRIVGALPSGSLSGEATLHEGSPPLRRREETSRVTTGPRRRALLAAGFAGLGLAVALGVAWFVRRPAASVVVAVLQPQAEGSIPGESLDLMRSAAHAAALRALLGLEGVLALAPEQVDQVSGSPVEVARAVAADEVVAAELKCGAAVCQVALRRIQGADGSLLWTEAFEAPVDQPHLLDEAVGSQLRRGYAGRKPRRGAPVLEVRAADYKEFLGLRNALDRGEGGLSPAEVDRRLAALLRSSPRFVEGWVHQAVRRKNRYYLRREPADLEGAFASLARARKLAPSDPRPLLTLFEVGLAGDRLDVAQEALAELETLQRGDPSVEVRRALLLERQGDSQGALTLIRDAARRRPSYHNLFRLADMELRLGDGAAARLDARRALERFPGAYQGQALLAQIELVYGSPDEARRIFEELTRRSPDSAGELSNLGMAYLLLRRWPDAEGAFRKVLELEPKSPYAYLNLADVLLLQGKREAARDHYTRLLELTQEEAASSDWQVLSLRAQALAHLGEKRQAVEAVQRLLLLAQANSQAACDAALVYAVVGDEASALVNADKAIKQGIGARWFSFPWFDPLRANPEFQAVLAAAP